VPAAPSAAASVISLIVTGRRRLDLTMPRKAEAESFGKRTTLPSGCKKNLTRSPGFKWRCSRIAFGIVAWPLTVIAESIMDPHYLCPDVIPRRVTGVKMDRKKNHFAFPATSGLVAEPMDSPRSSQPPVPNKSDINKITARAQIAAVLLHF
jgi:hypothetical protein